jgi:hypothetical protein
MQLLLLISLRVMKKYPARLLVKHSRGTVSTNLLLASETLLTANVIEAVQHITLYIILLITLDTHIVVLSLIVILIVHDIILTLLVDIILFIILLIIIGIILFILDILIIIRITHNYIMFVITLIAVDLLHCQRRDLLVIWGISVEEAPRLVSYTTVSRL